MMPRLSVFVSVQSLCYAAWWSTELPSLDEPAIIQPLQIAAPVEHQFADLVNSFDIFPEGVAYDCIVEAQRAMIISSPGQYVPGRILGIVYHW